MEAVPVISASTTQVKSGMRMSKGVIGMTAKRLTISRKWCVLAGDGAVITAGTMSLLTGAVLLVTGVMIKGSVPVWLEVGSGIAVLFGGLAGPIAAWLVHGERISAPAVIGALLSGPVTGTVFFAFVLASTALGWILRGVNDEEWFGPLVGAALVAAAFAALCAWLAVDALRDLRSSRREHVRVDVVRLASVAVIIVYSATVMVFSLRPGTGEVLEAIAFMLMGALAGGAAVGLADIVQRSVATRKVGDQAGA